MRGLWRLAGCTGPLAAGLSWNVLQAQQRCFDQSITALELDSGATKHNLALALPSLPSLLQSCYHRLLCFWSLPQKLVKSKHFVCRELRSQGAEPTARAGSNVISALCKANAHLHALSIFDDMLGCSSTAPNPAQVHLYMVDELECQSPDSCSFKLLLMNVTGCPESTCTVSMPVCECACHSLASMLAECRGPTLRR